MVRWNRFTRYTTTTRGNANYAKQHGPTLTIWTDYLVKNGFDPTNQLCTDDFAGHLARNANLSVKAIVDIASYGYLAGRLGDKVQAKKYTDLVRKWMTLAADRTGDHYTFTFDNENGQSTIYPIPHLTNPPVTNLKIPVIYRIRIRVCRSGSAGW